MSTNPVNYACLATTNNTTLTLVSFLSWLWSDCSDCACALGLIRFLCSCCTPSARVVPGVWLLETPVLFLPSLHTTYCCRCSTYKTATTTTHHISLVAYSISRLIFLSTYTVAVSWGFLKFSWVLVGLGGNTESLSEFAPKVRPRIKLYFVHDNRTNQPKSTTLSFLADALDVGILNRLLKVAIAWKEVQV